LHLADSLVVALVLNFAMQVEVEMKADLEAGVVEMVKMALNRNLIFLQPVLAVLPLKTVLLAL
jgi:hypothetical protein